MPVDACVVYNKTEDEYSLATISVGAPGSFLEANTAGMPLC
jgi:hypothetical protein